MLIILFYFRTYQSLPDGNGKKKKKKGPSPTDHLRNNEINTQHLNQEILFMKRHKG